MKITKRQLRRIIREEKARMLSENPAMRGAMRSGSKGGGGGMPDIPKKDRDTMVKEIEPQLKAAIESGKTKGIPQGWIDAASADSFHDADPKFSLRRPEANGGPTDEEIMALSKALNPSMFTKFKRLVGMKEGTMKIRKSDLQRIIKEEKQKILVEMNAMANATRMQGEYADTAAVDGVENALSELMFGINESAFEDMGDEDDADAAAAAAVTLTVAQSFQSLGLLAQYEALIRTL